MPDTPLLESEWISSALTDAVGIAGDPTLIASLSDGLMTVRWGNRAFVDTIRSEIADLAGLTLPDLMVCPFGDLPLTALRSTTFPVATVGRDGSTHSWDAAATPTTVGNEQAWVIVLRPPTADGQLDELLRASEERFRALAERAPIGIFSSEVGLRLGYVNDALAELVGVTAEALLGTGWMDHVVTQDLERVMGGLQSALTGVPFDGPARLTTADGGERWVNLRVVPVRSVGTPAAFLGTVEDVTDRRRFEDLLAWQASHDSLTRLPNRGRLDEDLEQALAGDTSDLAVMFFDLDDFKAVNDRLGHRAGDDLLVTIADRLRHGVRDTDRVYRFAGDEFVVIARGVADDREALGFADRLRAHLTAPVPVAGTEATVGCSVGVVRSSAAATPSELLRDADVAMYRAKRSGKGATSVYDDTLRAEVERHLSLLTRLRVALDADALGVNYRPVLDATTRTPVAVDAAVGCHDWDDADPVELAAAVEQIGADPTTLRLLLRRATGDLGALRDGLGIHRLSVPVTASQFVHPGLVDLIARSLVSSDVTSREVGLRISQLWWNPEDPAMLAAAEELVDLGVTLELEDVGAGPCAVAALTHPAIGTYRLARALLADDGPTLAAAAALVDLSRRLGRRTIGPVWDDASFEVAVTLGVDLLANVADTFHTLESLVPGSDTPEVTR